MGKGKETLAKICDNCPLCNYARNKPETVVGRIMEWHGKFCPAWKAQAELAQQRENRSGGE